MPSVRLHCSLYPFSKGNNWGTCDDGTSGMGCGPQETFRSCSDIQIEPHPLLSTPAEQEEFYQESLLENELSHSGLDVEIESDQQQKLASIRRKEALLKRKKLLLKQLIKKLRHLIEESSRLNGETQDQMTSPQRPMMSQILPPDISQKDFQQSVKPWWERIMSNKH